ncbi:MAG TPA: hypothetical protein VNU19_13430, partial [Candidatus Acidoferrum sp.]|nr:hypothetical protein [Candidatus Acidoferrum sp.]
MAHDHLDASSEGFLRKIKTTNFAWQKLGVRDPTACALLAGLEALEFSRLWPLWLYHSPGMCDEAAQLMHRN